MKSILLYLCLLLLGVVCHAQEKTVVLSDSMFNAKGELDLSNLDGWFFHPDCNAQPTAVAVNTKEWTALKPSQLSTDQINASGRACGWFRINVRLDKSINTAGLGVKSAEWVASDLYINGVKITSFGNTGFGDSVFKEHKANKRAATLVSLQPDSLYVIAFRVVQKDPDTPEQLAAKSSVPKTLVLTNHLYNDYIISAWSSVDRRDGLTTSAIAVLTLLFWLIYLLNRSEKNILHFAIGSTILTVFSIARMLVFYEEFTLFMFRGVILISALALALFILYVPFILAGIFKGGASKLVKVLIAISATVMIVGVFLQTLFVSAIPTIIPLLISLYYLFSSLKNLNRSRWAIVTGFLSSLVFLLVSFVAEDSTIYIQLSILSVPLGMLGYVAFRFREMITEVQVSSDQIIALSEEKRIQAENQQAILEQEVERQTKDLKDALHHLQETQQQLVHAEKMASLGELTAGIAHEIQNPLNFVKNFSEVSVDLLAEMKAELQADNTEEVAYIADDVSENLKKIIHHGNRADSIVKGMLLHSRSGSGIRESTDINALVDEYLRLGYHGLRAKDKTFNATLVADYDETAGKLDLVQQDMGRVLLNLITNAFYATHEKKKAAGTGYEPKVSVRTSIEGDQVRIDVSDNGGGIPEEVMKKIFQPFFTTKPTGEGTGLGLSIAYDIVKSHGGQLRVESKVGEGTTFVITLPKG